MGNFTTSLGIQWTPPAAADNSGNSTLSTAGTEQAQSVGTIDVPNGTVVGSVLPIPFGSVGAAKVCVVENKMSTEVGVRLNGSLSDEFTLGPGQRFAVSGPVAGSTLPLTQVELTTTADPTQTEKINYWIFGD